MESAHHTRAEAHKLVQISPNVPPFNLKKKKKFSPLNDYQNLHSQATELNESAHKRHVHKVYFLNNFLALKSIAKFSP